MPAPLAPPGLASGLATVAELDEQHTATVRRTTPRPRSKPRPALAPLRLTPFSPPALSQSQSHSTASTPTSSPHPFSPRGRTISAMASSSTTTTTTSKPMPLLLSSFPAPPSHIPASPVSGGAMTPPLLSLISSSGLGSGSRPGSRPTSSYFGGANAYGASNPSSPLVGNATGPPSPYLARGPSNFAHGHATTSPKIQQYNDEDTDTESPRPSFSSTFSTSTATSSYSTTSTTSVNSTTSTSTSTSNTSTSTASTTNPPPSRPPSMALPALPSTPSPIGHAEQLLLLGMARGTGSRRTSLASVRSVRSNTSLRSAYSGGSGSNAGLGGSAGGNGSGSQVSVLSGVPSLSRSASATSLSMVPSMSSRRESVSSLQSVQGSLRKYGSQDSLHVPSPLGYGFSANNMGEDKPLPVVHAIEEEPLDFGNFTGTSDEASDQDGEGGGGLGYASSGDEDDPYGGIDVGEGKMHAGAKGAAGGRAIAMQRESVNSAGSHETVQHHQVYDDYHQELEHTQEKEIEKEVSGQESAALVTPITPVTPSSLIDPAPPPASTVLPPTALPTTSSSLSSSLSRSATSSHLPSPARTPTPTLASNDLVSSGTTHATTDATTATAADSYPHSDSEMLSAVPPPSTLGSPDSSPVLSRMTANGHIHGHAKRESLHLVDISAIPADSEEDEQEQGSWSMGATGGKSGNMAGVGIGSSSMRLLPRVQTSLSSLRTGTSGSSGTLSAVSVRTQDASPSSQYTTHSPLSPPPQSAQSVHTHHSGSSHSPLSPLYHPSAVNTPTSPSAFSFIHPFGSAPGSSTSASFPHIGTPPASAASARSQVSQYSAGHHARKSSLVTSFAMGPPYSSGSAYATHEPSTPVTPIEPSSPSSIPPSPLALRPDEDALTLHHRIRAERSRSRRHREGLRGEYGAELVNRDSTMSVDVEGEGKDDEAAHEKRRGRMGREEVESPRSAGGHASAATTPSSGSATDTMPFSPSAFPAVPDMVPYPAGASANMKRQVTPNPQANESRETLGSTGSKTSMDTMDTFGGKSKSTTSTASLATTTTFSTQEDDDEYDSIRRPSLDSLTSASSRASEASAASTSTVSTTNSLALVDEEPTTPFGPTFPESAAPSAATLSPPRRGRGSPDVEDMLARTPRPRRAGSAIAADRSTRLSGASVGSLSSVGSTQSRGSARVGASRMSSSRSLPARSRANGPGKMGGGSSRAADEFGSLLGGMQDEPEFGFGGSISNSNSDAGSVSGSEEGGGSDSSLDLHTPLPHLMFRDGLLSPRSKLFAATRASSSLMGELAGADTRPMSSASQTSLASAYSAASMSSNISTASNMTKSGLYKDERDTTRRRVRHRDGKLLRGGIGLTTGLGWSDSEDEDAPSPLTRQLSSVGLRKKAAREAREREKEAEKEGLSRASSVASVVAVRPSPLRREVDDRAGARESIMSVGSVGSVGSMGSMGSVRSAPSRTTSSTQLKKTGSSRSLWSVPDEDGPQDQSIDGLPTPATTPIPPRVLPGRKRSESGASSINSVMAAATASASRTRTDSFASTSSARSLTMSSKSSPSLRQPSTKSKSTSGSMSTISAAPSNATSTPRRPGGAAGGMGGIPRKASAISLRTAASSSSVMNSAPSAASSLSRSSSSPLAAAGSSTGSRTPVPKNAALPQYRARTISASVSSAPPKSMSVGQAHSAAIAAVAAAASGGAGSGSGSVSTPNTPGTARKMEFYTRLPAAPRPLQLGALALNTPPSVGVQPPTPSASESSASQGAYAVSTGAGERVLNYNRNTHDRQRAMAALVHPASALPTASPASSSMSSSRSMSSSMSSRTPSSYSVSNAGGGMGPRSVSSSHSSPRLQGLQTIKSLQSLQTLHQTLSNSRSASASAAQHAVPTPSPSSPTRPNPDGRPRTGTGMAYRRTSGGYTAGQQPTGVAF